ncbi:hypothetical protein GCM10027447_06950 [Glycomyces halotolerans]
MDVKDRTESKALAARLQLELAGSAQPRRVCEETVEVASGEVDDEPLSRPSNRQRLTARTERLQARLGLSHLNRWVLAVIAIAVAAAGLFVTVLSWPRSEPAATAPVEAPPPTSARPETIVVSVAGAVERPGIVELEAGARVADAIEAAGGLADGADPGFLNLARVVSDGDLVAVPDAAAAQGAGGAGGSAAGLVNLNVADPQHLASLTGIGPVLAERIVSYRETNGSFQSIDELSEVQGIGPNLLDQIREQVTL